MPKYVFHHLPRCAGTSCRCAFGKWFRVVSDYRKDWTPEANEAFVSNKLDLARLAENHMLAGHFEMDGAHLHQRYPEVLNDPEYRLITFVRNPIEIPQSMHHYAKKKRPDYKTSSVARRVASRANFLADLLQCNEDNYRAVIDRYFFVGIVERLRESFDLLAHLLDKPPVDLPLMNDVPRTERLTEAEEEKFFEENQLDYDIYGYCCEKFAARLADAQLSA